MIHIGGKPCGYGHVPILTADIAHNHNGDIDLALKTIDAIADAGFDGAKLQYYRTEDFCQPDSKEMLEYTSQGKKVTERYYDFCKRHEISLDFVADCREYATGLDMIFGVTTTSAQGVRDVAEYCDYFKIASDMVSNGEMLDEMEIEHPFMPRVLSAGHLDINSESGEFYKKKDTIILHCVPEYPANHAKLWKITHYRQIGLMTGYSDHTTTNEAVIRAVDLGAVFIEVHATLDKYLPGEGHHYSKDPQQLKALVEAIK